MGGEPATILGPGALLGQVVRSRHAPGIHCLEVVYPAGSHLRNHAHERPFVALLLDGAYRERVAGKAFDRFPRSVVFHPAGEEHAELIGSSMARFLVVQLDTGELEHRYGCAPPTATMSLDGGHPATLLTAVYQEVRYPDSCSSVAIQGLVLQLMAACSRTKLQETGTPSWLRRIEEILRERFLSTLAMKEIAAEVGVSATHASAAFRRAHRVSIAEAQRRLRIEFACSKLRDGDPSLSQLATEAGFSDQPHFSRAFKQITGMTPSRYQALFASTPVAVDEE